MSSLERLRKCGRVPVTPGGGVAVRLKGGIAGFAGLATCGSVWADPVCNAKVMARRALEVGAAVATWQQQGGTVAFGTFTMRHHKGQGLGDLWAALSKAWAKATSGKAWVDDRQRYGVAGWLRIVEVTHGANGWHVHVHALLFLDGKVLDVRGLHARMFGRWSRALVRLELAAPLAIGQDMHVVTSAADNELAAYFTKARDGAHRVGLEVTQTQTKKARGAHKTRTPWALLDEVELLGLADSLDLWHQWEQGSRGKKQMTWSQGFRARLGLLTERSDEEIAAEEHGSMVDDLVLISAAGWQQLRSQPANLADVLTVTERTGLGGLRVWLDMLGVEYSVAA